MDGPSIKTRAVALLAVFILLFGIPGGLLLWMTSVPGHSYEGSLPPLTAGERTLAARLSSHVRAIASVPHNVGHPEALEQAALYTESSLASLGYPVRRQPFRAGGIEVRNIEAVIEPAKADAPTLVIGAHYDSSRDAPGANDNATGTAAVIELARLLGDLRARSSLRIRLVLFVNEEPPFFRTESMGSLVFARRLKRSGENVQGMLSLEMLGFYSDRPGSQHYPSPLDMLYPDKGDFIAFVGPISSRGLVRRTIGAFRSAAQFPSVGGTAPSMMQGISWSDHWAFEQVGIPALMVTDTGPFRYPHYHSAEDTPDRVDYGKLARVVSGLERVVRRWATTTPTA